MWKIAVFLVITPLFWMATTPPPSAAADVNGYPCTYPGVGIGADALGATGQFCDGPTEINLSHYHCEGGGFHAGGLGLAGQNGVSIGAIAGIGGGGDGCSWRCPDNVLAPQPNPIGAYHQYIDVEQIIKAHKVFCADHLAPAGPTSALVSPDEGVPGDMPPQAMPANQGFPGNRPWPSAPDPNGTLPIPLPAIPLP